MARALGSGSGVVDSPGCSGRCKQDRHVAHRACRAAEAAADLRAAGRIAPDGRCGGADGSFVAPPRWSRCPLGLEFGLMGNVSYVSRVRIERLGGPQRLAFLPAEESPVVFGVHSEVAEHYGVRPEQYPPHATTLDYVVAAAGG